jgi:hypothetical protein
MLTRSLEALLTFCCSWHLVVLDILLFWVPFLQMCCCVDVLLCKMCKLMCRCVDVLMTVSVTVHASVDVLMIVLMCELMSWWLCRCLDVLACSCVRDDIVLMCWCVDDCVDCVGDCVDVLMCADVLMCWCRCVFDDCVDVLMWCWWLCVSMCWCVDVLMCWCVDMLMCRCVDVDVLMCWCVAVLMCWCVDVWMTLCWCFDDRCVMSWCFDDCVDDLCWCFDTIALMCWFFDVLMTLCWCVDDIVLMCWCVRVLMIAVLMTCVDDLWWCFDVWMTIASMHWFFDVLMCWCVGVCVLVYVLMSWWLTCEKKNTFDPWKKILSAGFWRNSGPLIALSFTLNSGFFKEFFKFSLFFDQKKYFQKFPRKRNLSCYRQSYRSSVRLRSRACMCEFSTSTKQNHGSVCRKNKS